MSKTTRPRDAVVLLSGNRLAVEPADPAVEDLLRPHLSYVEKKLLFGWEKRKAVSEGRSPVELTPVDLYTVDHRGRVVTHSGFVPRVRRALRHAGYSVTTRDLTPHPRPEVYEPDWSRLRDFELRHRQDELLAKLVSYRCGRFDCPPGFGKSTLIAFLAAACYRARVLVTTKRIAVLQKRIYPELCGMLPDVGILCSGADKNRGARVMCCSAGMLHHLPDSYDFLIADECHEFAVDSVYDGLGQFDRARYFGLSASHDMRGDGRDRQVEAFFGPVLMSVSYDEAVDAAMVVPIVVEWRDVRMHVNPCDGLSDTDRARAGVWANDYRNGLIAKDARRYDADVQVLAPVATLEHAANLKALLPEYEMVYRPGADNDADVRRYEARGLIPEGQPEMTESRYSELTSAFEDGRLRKAIVTTVWNVGVNFRQLAVLLRCDAGGGGERDVQVPGRVSRTFGGKDYGLIHDYLDQFDRGYRRNAGEREKNYAAQLFEQRFPPKPKPGTLHRYLFQE